MAQPIFKKIEGEPYLYEATYPSGTKKYAIRASRTGAPGKKQYFDFTPTGLRVAKKERDEWVKKTDKIIQDKVKKQGALDPAVKKVANPLIQKNLGDIKDLDLQDQEVKQNQA